ncbi:ferritin [Demetria terragena]|uniref:ferritin n=1 Tax=Demetria terragena TaxID=63959 RepID=UPI000374CF0F|nr:ferritin [Demetria terragena]
MKITPDLEKPFNDQITLELQASAVYRQLAIEMEIRDLPGMASWLRAQSNEEIVHADKFIDHVSDRGGRPVIGSLDAPNITATTPLEVFKAALAHEEKVSEAIRELYRAADSAGDLDSRPLLNWFIQEQVEEEASVGEIVGRLELIGEDGPGLLRMDAELGGRNETSGE